MPIQLKQLRGHNRYFKMSSQNNKKMNKRHVMNFIESLVLTIEVSILSVLIFVAAMKIGSSIEYYFFGMGIMLIIFWRLLRHGK